MSRETVERGRDGEGKEMLTTIVAKRFGPQLHQSSVIFPAPFTTLFRRLLTCLPGARPAALTEDSI